jgi:TRAP-type C4-dicarboxylate transport system permease small subunit
MTEPHENTDIEPTGGVQQWLFYVGAAGLLFAIGADALAVLGRHLGIPLLGSIELMQAAILLASSAAMVMATIARKHAVVHLLIDRLSPRRRSVMERVHALLSALFFAALGVGSAWIAFDLRNGHEQSELLRIPFAPLRIVSIVAVLAVAAIYLGRALRKRVSR